MESAWVSQYLLCSLYFRFTLNVLRFGTIVKVSDNLFTQNLNKNIITSSGSQFLQSVLGLYPWLHFFYCQYLIKNTIPDSVSTSFTDIEIQTVHCIQVSISASLLLFLFLLLLLLQPVKSNSRLSLPFECLLWQEDSGSIKNASKSSSTS